jgi:uncharacterized small protein (DUF1192 family)
MSDISELQKEAERLDAELAAKLAEAARGTHRDNAVPTEAPKE